MGILELLLSLLKQLVCFFLEMPFETHYDWLVEYIKIDSFDDSLRHAHDVKTAAKNIDQHDFYSFVVLQEVEAVQDVFDCRRDSEVKIVCRLPMQLVNQVERGHAHALTVRDHSKIAFIIVELLIAKLVVTCNAFQCVNLSIVYL